MCSVRECSNFILLHIVVQFSQHHLLKRLSFLHCILASFVIDELTVKCVGLFLCLLSCSLDLYVSFCASTILFWWLWLCSIVWIQGPWVFWLHSSFSRLFLAIQSFCISLQMKNFFLPVLWKMSLVIWQGLHWICTLPWVIWSF